MTPTHFSLLADFCTPQARVKVFSAHRVASSVGQTLGLVLAGALAVVLGWPARAKPTPRTAGSEITLNKSSSVTQKDWARAGTAPGSAAAGRPRRSVLAYTGTATENPISTARHQFHADSDPLTRSGQGGRLHADPTVRRRAGSPFVRCYASVLGVLTRVLGRGAAEALDELVGCAIRSPVDR